MTATKMVHVNQNPNHGIFFEACYQAFSWFTTGSREPKRHKDSEVNGPAGGTMRRSSMKHVRQQAAPDRLPPEQHPVAWFTELYVAIQHRDFGRAVESQRQLARLGWTVEPRPLAERPGNN